jgi:hypothetical protein
MWSVDGRACATLALIALGSVAGIASVDAQQRREYRPSEGQQRPAARRQAYARPSRRANPAPAAGVHAAGRADVSYTRARPIANQQRQMAARGVERQSHLAGGGWAGEVSHAPAGGQVRVVRYGHTLSGTVEHTIRPGLVSRTFVNSGHILYTRVYQHHVWHQFGRAFAYETFVPAVRFPAVYYGWALGAWPHPVAYSWGWQWQPWYPMYGARFTPYPVYVSPDQWMTDYIIAQSMQTAYMAQTAVPAPQPPLPDAAVEPAADSSYAEPTAQPGEPAPAPQASDAPPAPQPTDMPSAPVAAPPAITPQVKAELNAQIKVRLQEQQAAAATPATVTTQSGPPALRQNHVFFQVVQPLHVPSGTGSGYCSLSADDYIKRTGGMSNDDWTIPVVVELSGPSDCPQGLQTRIGLNDLNAMDNEQEAQVMEAMQAASKGIGPNEPPSGPGVRPTLIVDGNAAPDPGVLDAIRQAQ